MVQLKFQCSIELTCGSKRIKTAMNILRIYKPCGIGVAKWVISYRLLKGLTISIFKIK